VTPVEAIETLESAGGAVRLDGESVKVKLPTDYPDVAWLLAELRKHRNEVTALLRQRGARQRNLVQDGLDSERRFGQPHAKLFTFIGRKVRTPEGPGTLIQVYAERVRVLLDAERDKCSFFKPSQIEPVSTE
jgi:hypothetical protein